MSCSVHGDSVLGPPPLTGLAGHPHPGSHVLPPAPGSEHHHWHLSHAPRTRGAWGIFLHIQAMCACNLGLHVSHHGRLTLLAPRSSLHTRMVLPWLLNKVATDSHAGHLLDRTGSLRGALLPIVRIPPRPNHSFPNRTCPLWTVTSPALARGGCSLAKGRPSSRGQCRGLQPSSCPLRSIGSGGGRVAFPSGGQERPHGK